jgi:hypothetical protein
MNYINDARTLVNYIESLDSFDIISVPKNQVYSHIGGLFTDIVLQAGLNYNNVVKPRVIHLVFNYPEANTVKGFLNLINIKGLTEIINWRSPIKLQRISDIITFSQCNNIDNCTDLKRFLNIKSNRASFLNLKGIGPKSLDYTLKLLSFDTVAVDRHIVLFVKQAGLQNKDYYSIKSSVEYAADLMDISRTSIDYSIWKYMSEGKNKRN